MKPTTFHIAVMVDDLNEDNTRAAYMVVKQLHTMQTGMSPAEIMSRLRQFMSDNERLFEYNELKQK